MKVRLTAEQITTSAEHVSTTYKVFDKDMVLIIEETSTTPEEKEGMILTIDESYRPDTIYGSVIYNLTNESVTEGIITIAGDAEDILNFYPPKVVIVRNNDILTLTYDTPKRYLSLINTPLKIKVIIASSVTHVVLEEYLIDTSVDIPIKILPKYTHMVDIKSQFMLNGEAVSNISRKSFMVSPNLLTVNNTKYELNKEFEIKINLASFGYIDLVGKRLFYAKIFGKEKVIHMRPRADDATILYGVIDEELIDGYLLLKGIVGNTLIESRIQISKKG